MQMHQQRSPNPIGVPQAPLTSLQQQNHGIPLLPVSLPPAANVQSNRSMLTRS